MTIRAAFAMTVAITWGAGLALARTGAFQALRPEITIRVINESDADERALALARKEAVRIFAQAGIDLVWLDCVSGRADWGSDNPCQRERGASEFWLRIVSRKPAATTGHVLGFTNLDVRTGDGSAGIYYPAVAEMAKNWPVRIGDVLGAAIAHEVGHLMLGEDAHSLSGVMQANWGRAQCELIGISELNFAVAQAKELRKRVERRTGRKSTFGSLQIQAAR